MGCLQRGESYRKLPWICDGVLVIVKAEGKRLKPLLNHVFTLLCGASQIQCNFLQLFPLCQTARFIFP